MKKAYTVTEGYEGGAVVVFASNGAEARRMGALRLDMTFEEVESCTRSPAFDPYADAGKVPALVMIAAGWRFECLHCGHTIDSSYEGLDGEELEPVEDSHGVYCNQAHLMASWAERRDAAARDAASVEACATNFHGLPIFGLRGVRHYAVGGRNTVAACQFDFPGRTGILACWNVGDAAVYVSKCDMDAWKAIGSAQ